MDNLIELLATNSIKYECKTLVIQLIFYVVIIKPKCKP